MRVPETGLNGWMRETVYPRGTILPVDQANEGPLWERVAGMDERPREAPWMTMRYTNLRTPTPYSPYQTAQAQSGANYYVYNAGGVSDYVAAHAHPWSDIYDKAHTHVQADITDLDLLPAGGEQYQVLQRNADGDATWDWVRAHG